LTADDEAPRLPLADNEKDDMAHEFQLDGVVPWGRTADEYEAFFALHDVARGACILDCGGGPSSFAAEWSERGRRVVAVDPIYAFDARAIRGRFDATCAPMWQGMVSARSRFVWDFYGSPEALVERRRRALDLFLADRRAHESSGRYVAAALPELPFGDRCFDLVLCSHLLFLYSADLTLEMHVASIREMLRVGREVRIFPSLDLDGRESRHLRPTLEALQSEAETELIHVAFEFQRGARRMLRIRDRVRAG
jgi:ubiquinone/menaquinone biosynthesis C-methylase UbiE